MKNLDFNTKLSVLSNYVNSNNITDKGILITKENNLVFSNNERKIVVTENNLIIDDPLQSIEMDEEVLEH